MRRVAVIGPGRVGTALAMALSAAGKEIVAIAGRGSEALAGFTQRFPDAQVTTPGRAVGLADLIVVTVGDDQLEGIAKEVVKTVARDDDVVEGSRWIHTAGGYGPEVFSPITAAGGAVAACHPAQTFPDPDRGFAALPGTTWAVTAAEHNLGWARVLVTDLRGSPVTVASSSRTLYHVGLAVGANATSTVVTLARDLLLGAGVTDPQAFLGPLSVTAARNAADFGAAALTGPVRRGDAGMVARHLAELEEVMPEAVEAYLALSALTLRHARRAGLDPAAADAVASVLSRPGTDDQDGQP